MLTPTVVFYFIANAHTHTNSHIFTCINARLYVCVVWCMLAYEICFQKCFLFRLKQFLKTQYNMPRLQTTTNIRI